MFQVFGFVAVTTCLASQFKVGEIYLGSQFEGMVHHGRGCTAVEARDGRSQHQHQEAEKEMNPAPLAFSLMVHV